MAYEYNENGDLTEVSNFSWVENNVEPLKLTVTKAPPAWVNATPSPLLNPDASPADIAAYRLANSVKRPQNGPVEKTIIPEQDKRPSYVMEPDLQEAQGGMHLPPGMMQDDSGRFFYKDDPTATIPMVQRPGVLPIARTPEGYKLVMPKMLDLASNVMGNVAAPFKAARVAAKAGEMVLGSGMVKSTKDIPWEVKGFENANWFHGTTHEFDKFSKAKGNPENHLGQYPHFTSDPKDAAVNYAGHGPDLTGRIERRAEEIYGNLADDIIAKGGVVPNYGTKEYGELEKQSKELATKELAGPHEGAIIPAKMKLQNPVSLVDSKPTWIDFNNRKLKQLLGILEKQGEKYGFDGKKVFAGIADSTYGEVKASDLDKALRSNDNFMYAEGPKGKLVSSHLISEIFKGFGYDGIVMDARQAFPNMKNIPEGTLHAVPLKQNTVKGKYNDQILFSDTRNQVAGEVGHQIEKGPFYSQLERTVQQSKINLATPEQWLGYLKNQPGVKSEELNHVLKDLPKDGMLSKAEIENYVKQNKVELKEKVLGGENDITKLREDYEKLNPKPEKINRIEKTLTGFRDRMSREYEQWIQDRDEWVSKSSKPTKYHQYQLPGGENYKEILLSLPKNPERQKLINEHTVNRLRLDKIQDEFDDLRLLQDLEKAPKNIDEQRLKLAHEKVTLDSKQKELARKLDDAENKDYQAPHFDDNGTNLIGHLRTNERMIGNRVGTHIDELQSDWGQGIRKHGYKGEKEKLQPEFDKIEKKIVDSNDETVMGQPKIEDALKLAVEKKLITKAEADVYKRYTDIENGKPLPDMPFKKNWDELLLKKAIHSAVEKGHDFISWTPGEAQAARYDLSKHVNNIHIHNASSEGSHITINGKSGVIGSGTIDKNGRIIEGYDLLREAKDKNISEVVGKEVAEKIMQKANIPAPKRLEELPEGYHLNKDGKQWSVILPGQIHGRPMAGLHDTKEEALRQAFNHIHSTEAQKGHTLENIDLKIGGEGMKAFYDKMLVDRANAIGKKYGAKVEQKELPDTNKYEIKRTGDKHDEEAGNSKFFVFKNGDIPKKNEQMFDTRKEAEEYIKSQKGPSIHYMELTPELKAKAKEGFPLFSTVNPTLVPIDGNPFEDQKKKVKLTPVSHVPVFK